MEDVYKSNFVLIDSNDRDVNEFPTHSSFSFKFGDTNVTGNSDKPFIPRKFVEVEYVAVKRVILPATNDELPYMLIRIPELGGSLYGSNDNISASFCYLSNGTTKGNFLIFDFENLTEESDNQGMKILNPRIEISKLSFFLTKPNGEPVVFTDTSLNACIELEINIVKKELHHTNFIFRNS